MYAGCYANISVEVYWYDQYTTLLVNLLGVRFREDGEAFGGAGEVATEIELIRSTEEEKGQQIENVRNWQRNRNALAPAGETSHSHEVAGSACSDAGVHDGHGLAYLQNTARERRNVFAALIEAVKTHSLGQISHALYDVGGEYRRNM